MPNLSDIRKQVEAFSKIEAFFDSAVIFALHEVGVFKIIATGQRSLDQIHAKVEGNKESLRAVLDAGVALHILSKSGTEYTASEVWLDCLGRTDSPSYIGESVSYLRALARPLLELDRVVLHGKPILDVESIMATEEADRENSWSALMTGAMDAYCRTRGIEIVDKIDFSKSRSLLDLGAGPGTYSLAICQKFPNIRATLVDVPGPLAIADKIAQQRGVRDRIELVEADIFTYVPKTTFDEVLVSNTLHMLGTETAVSLLKKIHAWITPGGRIIIQGHLLNAGRTSPRWATLLNLIQRTITPHGRNHDVVETQDWLRQANFAEVAFVPFSLWNVNRAVIGRRLPA
jgi:precorrin-6B methylase 2